MHPKTDNNHIPDVFFTYHINADNIIVAVDNNWRTFAQENNASNLATDQVVGRPLFDFISDKETRQLYHAVFDKVRREQRELLLPFRCDGPTLRRYMQLEVSPQADNGLHFSSRLLREETRDAVPLLDNSIPRTDEFLMMCSWCKQVAVEGDWLEVEDAVKALKLFDKPMLPQITHGICPDCYARVDQIATKRPGLTVKDVQDTIRYRPPLKLATKLSTTDDRNFHVIGIGASAGGLGALKAFFKQIPAGCQHSFVVVQHLAPEHKSLMPELLARDTKLPVREATDTMILESGHVYLMPPGKNIILARDIFKLVDRSDNSPGHINLPINLFFHSLASELGAKAIGIILSGTGSDGTNGVRAIKQAGGVIMVQEPTQAAFDGMPYSAIRTGLVDFVLPVEKIPAELFNLIAHYPLDDKDAQRIAEDMETFSQILRHLKALCNIDFMDYKRPTLLRRTAYRMNLQECHSLTDYLEILYASTEESQALCREFLIGVTQFFRDPDIWRLLGKNVISALISDTPNGQQIKVWSAGCSTGEEAYTLAILLHEEVRRQNRQIDIKVFATDLNKSYLDIASRGIYPKSIAEDVPPALLAQHFIEKGDTYQISQHIRRLVIFSQHDLIQDPPFGKMSMICCRNLLIYLDIMAQEKVIHALHYALKKNGSLMLGSSESLGIHAEQMHELNRKGRIYQNTQPLTTRSPGLYQLTGNYTAPVVQQHRSRQTQQSAENQMDRLMTDVMAERFGMAGVYVDQQLNIIHAIGNLSQYLALPTTGFSLNLLKILPASLSAMVNLGTRDTNNTGQQWLQEGIQVQEVEQPYTIDILIKPLSAKEVAEPARYLVTFSGKQFLADGITVPSVATMAEPNIIAPNEHLLLRELEAELQETRQRLQQAIEASETSNEELQANNEELLAASEEMQSTNEELQSLNEELQIVNTEYRDKLNEIRLLSQEMDSVLECANLGLIFLDKDLRIRKFTHNIRIYFDFIDGDIGRPIKSFFGNLTDADGQPVMTMIQAALSDGKSSEDSVQVGGQWLSRRIIPFIEEADVINGVIIVFIDIALLKHAEDQLAESEALFRQLFDDAPIGIALANAKREIVRVNKYVTERLGHSAEEVTQRQLGGFLSPDMPNYDLVQQQMEALFAGQLQQLSYEGVGVQKNGETRSVNARVAALHNVAGEFIGALSISEDVTDKKQVERALTKSEAQFRLLFENAPIGIALTNAERQYILSNRYLQKITGYSEEEILQRRMNNFLRPDEPNYDLIRQQTDDLFAGRRQQFDFEVERVNKHGEARWLGGRINALLDADGQLVGSLAILQDITARKQVELALVESEAQLRLLFENAPLGMALTNAERQFIWANKNLREATGYSEVDIKQRRMGDFLNPNTPDYERIQQQTDALFAGRIQQFDYETQGLKKNGQPRWANGHVAAMHNADGEFIGVLSISEDITDRKLAENKRLESEAMFRQLFEASPTPIYLTDMSGRLVQWNKPLEMLLGYDTEELKDINIWQLGANVDNPENREKFAGVRAGIDKDVNLELEVFDKARRPLQVILHSRPIKNAAGEVTHLLTNVIDITQRKQAELKLAESEAQFRLLFEASPIGIIMTNADGQFVMWNKRFEMLSGYRDKELAQSHVDKLLVPDNPENIMPRQYLQELYEGHLDSFNFEAETTRKDNQPFWMSVHAVALRNSSGELSNMLITVEDITDIKQTTAQLQQSHNALAIANTKLQLSNQELEQFAYIASHDLQSPLSNISGFSDLLVADYHHVLDAEGAEYVTRIQRSIHRMQELIKALLEYSRIGRNRQLENVDLNVVVADVLEDLEITLQSNQATVHTSSLPTLQAYPQELRRLLQNLLQNAAKFRKPDTSCEIYIKATPVKDGWQLAVQDNGIGIAEKFQEKIFNIFQRLHNQNEYEGTGIGLAQCRKIVELHSGKLWVESTPGEGSTFYFTIPEPALAPSREM